MPYIVSEYRPIPEGAHQGGTMRLPFAVATLERAREYAYALPVDAPSYGEYDWIYEAIDALPKSGGTIGPLPDGTVIEIRRIDWHEITGRLPDSVNRESATAVLDAFNAR